MAQSIKRFLLVDDDPVSNFLSKSILKKSFQDIEVINFNIPELALKFIQTDYDQKQSEGKTTLFLDINMPTLSGWEFLTEFNALPEPIKIQFDIYMLSSSIKADDIQAAKRNPLVIDFIKKPLDNVILLKLFS